MFPGLFDGFDPRDVQAAIDNREAEIDALGAAKVLQRRHRVHTRQVSSDDAIAKLLPARIDSGDSFHVLSTGDIDVLSFTRHLLAGLGSFDSLVMTTWRINKDDLEQIERWLNAGQVEEFHLLIDVRFQRLAPDEYRLAKHLTQTYGGTTSMCLNHSKLTLMSNAAANAWYVIESSANVNTNRRLEQSAIHNCLELHDFYTQAIHGIRNRRAAQPA